MIANVPAGLEAHVDQCARSFGMGLNDIEGMSGKGWLFLVLELLRKKVDGKRDSSAMNLRRLSKRSWTLARSIHRLRNAMSSFARPATRVGSLLSLLRTLC
jgi:hypothetical protein